MGNYKDVDENPYDPYWEQMEQAFGESNEYEELEKNGLVEDSDAYESWPDMRRRMASRNKLR